MKNGKSHVLKALTGERAFKAATISVLALLTLFFTGIVLSMMVYTDWDTLFSTLISREILFAIRLSLTTATIATVISIVIAIPVAYAISQTEFPGKDIIDTILDLPIVISPIALGAALLVFFNTPIGAGIENRVMRFVFEVPGIVLAQFTVVSALAVRLLKSTFDSIDPRYEQVGRTLGCSKLKAFLRVTLPLAKDGLIAAGILTWARAVGEFGATVMLAGATKMKTETLPIAIFLNLATADVEKAVAVIFILIAISASALIVLRRISGKRWQI
ncbi:MAG: ABC transporter permease subunit [Desulfobacteraceae bacterium]|nr:ABC transporter permease subunit [Desulfobacteraceae bacterium]